MWLFHLIVLFPAFLAFPSLCFGPTFYARSPPNQAGQLVDVTSSRPLLPIHVTWEFPLGTWVENIAIRNDGDALVTILSSPEVYLVPTRPPHRPTLVATIPDALGLVGIAEIGIDVFYVGAGNFSTTTLTTTPGTYSIWKVDLRNVAPSAAKLSKVTDIPEAVLLNGLTVVNPVKGILLIADSGAGVVWSLDVNSGSYAIAINDTSMDPPVGTTGGINGIQISGNELLYSNFGRGSLHKIPVSRKTGQATGPAITLFESPSFSIDDFAIDFQGDVWAALNVASQLDFLPDAAATSTTSTNATTVAGTNDSSSIAGFTAAQFGTSERDLERGSIYITTTGGYTQWLYQNWTTGGTVSRVDVRSFLI
ncbi:MAG: hypothetical protein Q9190_005326 [Brigantiaea leucoxantha]